MSTPSVERSQLISSAAASSTDCSCSTCSTVGLLIVRRRASSSVLPYATGLRGFPGSAGPAFLLLLPAGLLAVVESEAGLAEVARLAAGAFLAGVGLPDGLLVGGVHPFRLPA